MVRRGVWGNGDGHGNAIKMLPVLRHMKMMQDTGRPPTVKHVSLTRHFPQFINGGELSLEGEKFLARVKYVLPFLKI